MYPYNLGFQLRQRIKLYFTSEVFQFILDRRYSKDPRLDTIVLLGHSQTPPIQVEGIHWWTCDFGWRLGCQMCGTLRFPLKPAAIHVGVFESIPARFPKPGQPRNAVQKSVAPAGVYPSNIFYLKWILAIWPKSFQIEDSPKLIELNLLQQRPRIYAIIFVNLYCTWAEHFT